MSARTEAVPCPKVKSNASPTPWRCQSAAGHDGDCSWPVESRHYAMPLDQFDKGWLMSEVRMLHAQIERLERERADDDCHITLRHVLGRLINLAPADATRKTVALPDVRKVWQDHI